MCPQRHEGEICLCGELAKFPDNTLRSRPGSESINLKGDLCCPSGTRAVVPRKQGLGAMGDAETSGIPADGASREHSTLMVSWRTLALAMTIISIALTTTLAIVTYEGGVDQLATLALALAILVFVVQIIVYIAQANSSGQQLLRAEELHGRTMEALRAIEEKAEGTRATVTSMNDRVLNTLIGRVQEEVEAKGVDPSSPEIRAEVEQRISDMAARFVQPRAVEGAIERTPTPRSRIQLSTPTGEALERALEALHGLDNPDYSDIRLLGEDYITYGANRRGPLGHGIELVNNPDALRTRAIVRRVRVPWSATPVFKLTPFGLDVAALLINDVPNLPPELAAIKKRWERVRSQLSEEEARRRARIEGVPIDSMESE